MYYILISFALDFIGANITEMMNCTTASCQLGWNFQPKPGCTGTDCYRGGLIFDAQVWILFVGISVL